MLFAKLLNTDGDMQSRQWLMFKDISTQPIWQNDGIWKEMSKIRIEYMNDLYINNSFDDEPDVKSIGS